MANNTNNFGGNLTTIIVSFMGMLGALGAAWITTQGAANTQAPTPAAVVNQAAAPQTSILAQAAASAAPVVPVADSNTAQAPASVAAAPPVTNHITAPQPLPNSRLLDYNQSWPNEQRATGLVLESVEIAAERVRLHLRFDAPANRAVTFYTTDSDAGLRAAMGEKKLAQVNRLESGGGLFAHPQAVTLAAGSQTTGWIDYAVNSRKISGLTIGLTSATEGYLTAGQKAITYQPVKFKFDEASDD